MQTTLRKPPFHRCRSLALAAVLCVGAAVSPPLHAGKTDISDTPLASVRSAKVKPNIMLLMDTSGSMGWTHMPDEVERVVGIDSVGYKSSQCNTLYFNPSTAQTYGLPNKADGTAFPTPPFEAAPYDAFDTASTKVVDLAKKFQAYDSKSLRLTTYEDTPQAAYYYVYSGPQTLTYSSEACKDADDGVLSKPATGGGTWTRVVVSDDAEKARFARWYTYYRTRINLIKSAASLAFTPITDTRRVGFITVQPKDTPSSAEINKDKYLPIADFDSKQRVDWYAKLFSQKPGGASPAREGLARVGRHYAGKQDGINAGMTGDPVQYYCQQNFTFLTTDGYWNDQTESPGGGPVQLDGVTLVGQQDGQLTPDKNWTPRTVYEGVADSTRIVTDKTNYYDYAVCNGSYYDVHTTQWVKNASHLEKATSQITKGTVRNLQTTLQYRKSSTQNLETTQQVTASTTHVEAASTQRLRSTEQIVKSTSQLQRIGTQMIQETRINSATTAQILKTTEQKTQGYYTVRVVQTQIWRSIYQRLKSTEQKWKSTSRVTESTSQLVATKTQATRYTSQLTTRTTKVTQATSQVQMCDDANESCTPKPPIDGCSPSGLNITCKTVTTGPTPVVSCKPDAALPANKYVETICSTISSEPQPVGSCSEVPASTANGFVAVECPVVKTGPTLTDLCTVSPARGSNQWTETISCPTKIVGTLPDPNCKAEAAGKDNGYIATTCDLKTTEPSAVPSCKAEKPDADNKYTETICTPIVTTKVPVADCTESDPTAGNLYTTTTCGKTEQIDVPTMTCTTAAPSAGNQNTSVTCSNLYTVTTELESCPPSKPFSAQNGWIRDFCWDEVLRDEGTDLCEASSPTKDNNWVTTTCPAPDFKEVASNSCVDIPATKENGWLAKFCVPHNSYDQPASSCTPTAPTAENWYTETTCPPQIVTGPKPVTTCTPTAADASNSYVATVCSAQTVVAAKPVQTCTYVAGDAGNGYQETTCTTKVTRVGVATCGGTEGPTADNGWTTYTCGTGYTDPVWAASCTYEAPSAKNGFVETLCADNNTVDVPVPTCGESSKTDANFQVKTTCRTVAPPPQPVEACDPVAASSANSYTAINCAVVSTGPSFVPSCTDSLPKAPAWTATTCNVLPPVTVPAPACQATAGPPVGPDYKTITCPDAVVIVDQPSETCNAEAALEKNKWTATTCVTNESKLQPVASCNEGPASATNDWTKATCSRETVDPLAGAPSCKPQVPTDTDLLETICGTDDKAFAPAQSCDAKPGDGDNQWTNITCRRVDAVPEPVPSCEPFLLTKDPTEKNGWTTTDCKEVKSDSKLEATCTPAEANKSNNYVATKCTQALGQKVVVHTDTSETTTDFSGPTPASESKTNTTQGVPFDVDGVCYVPGVSSLPLLSSFATKPPPPSGCTAWPCITSHANSGLSPNSLADVAQYYYVTDLRPELKDGVPARGQSVYEDIAPHQHMTTFSIALGASGSLTVPDTYLTDTSGDFYDIKYKNISTGKYKAWPAWPDETLDYANDKSLWDNTKSLDDFCHTGTNGRGVCLSAKNPGSVVTALQRLLQGADLALAANAAVGVSTRQLTETDRFAYVSSYKTPSWTGELAAYKIGLTDGVLEEPPKWLAGQKLSARVKADCDTRTIYLLRPGASASLVDFSWDTHACNADGTPDPAERNGLNADEKAQFDATKIALLSQYTGMNAAQRAAATGQTLVNYLRGQTGHVPYTQNVPNNLYRNPGATLGALIDAQPVYVGAPFASYGDKDYKAFKDANLHRTPMVYAAANDGMLHAFYASLSDANGGEEAWAVVPSAVLPNLYKQADEGFGLSPQQTVDGSPTIGDVYGKFDGTNPVWKTVLVGGLRKGGKGYYALDITDPASPKALWEFKWGSACYDDVSTDMGADCNLGLTFGRPVISKLADGRWVVLVTSGVNNLSGSPRDGEGFLYVLDAVTGKIISKTSTGEGDATDPSGLTQINSFVDYAVLNNTTVWVYGGDLRGNVWRFDVNAKPPTATLVATAKDSKGDAQPITTRPELAELNGKPMVLVATGKLWGASDLPSSKTASSTQTQSVYGFVDPLLTKPYADLRAELKPMTLSLNTDGKRIASFKGTEAEAAREKGWLIDLPDSGERVSVDMDLQLGTLFFASNVPTTDDCTWGGYGWFNYVDFGTGNPVVGDTLAGVRHPDSLIGGIVIVKGASDKLGFGLTTETRARVVTDRGRFGPVVPDGRRTSWREIIQ